MRVQAAEHSGQVEGQERREIEEKFRIEKQKATLDFLINGGAKVCIISHITSIESFKPLLSQIENILDRKINFLDQLEQLGQFSHPLFML